MFGTKKWIRRWFLLQRCKQGQTLPKRKFLSFLMCADRRNNHCLKNRASIQIPVSNKNCFALSKAQFLTFTLSHSLTLSLSHSHKLPFSQTPILSLSLILKLPFSYSHSLSNSHSFTHTNGCVRQSLDRKVLLKDMQ